MRWILLALVVLLSGCHVHTHSGHVHGQAVSYRPVYRPVVVHQPVVYRQPIVVQRPVVRVNARPRPVHHVMAHPHRRRR
jgi:hypothetical protein